MARQKEEKQPARADAVEAERAVGERHPEPLRSLAALVAQALAAGSTSHEKATRLAHFSHALAEFKAAVARVNHDADPEMRALLRHLAEVL